MESGVATDKRALGKSQIEAAIGVMLNARGMKLDRPIGWRHDVERDVYAIDASINGNYCSWVLIGDAVENYFSDLNVRYSVDFNLTSYFLPR